MAKQINITSIRQDAQNMEKQFKNAIEKDIANTFPIDVFPNQVQSIIKELNQFLKFPIDFTGVSILYSSSLAIGNTHKVKVRNGWNESAVLYACIVGRSGTNKSHPLSFAITPILKKDEASFQLFIKEKENYQYKMSLTKKERLENGYDEPLPPKLQKFLLSDYTPEAVADIHLKNRRGIGVYVDELAGWFKNFNRYNKGSEQEQWLSNWSGKPIIADRKTGNSVFIDNPFINVIGTIQNDVLEEISKESRDSNGFIDRILFAIPDNLQKEYWSDEEMNEETLSKYNQIIEKIMSIPFDSISLEPKILTFGESARKKLFAWQRQNTDRANAQESDKTASIYSKLEVYISRFCLILQIIRWACNEGGKDIIEEKTVENAIILTEYFRINAEKVQQILSNNNAFDKLSKDKKKIYNDLPATFKTEIGVQIAENNDMKERTFKEWLKDKNLFEKVSHGNYEKLL